MGKHLTLEQRAKLEALHRLGLTQAAIAAEIGSNQSVVSRELRRNKGGRGYRCQQAQDKATARRSAASLIPRKLDDTMIALIEDKLWREEWSPQQISCWLARSQQTRLSHERIYQLIWADKVSVSRSPPSPASR
jgi:IS30 family transposase